VENFWLPGVNNLDRFWLGFTKFTDPYSMEVEFGWAVEELSQK
jgi:hypothetical protein